MTLTATMTAIEHHTSLAQQAADQAADREYERRERIEREVTFSDLLEEMAESFDLSRRRAFMDSLAKDESEVVIAMVQNAKERVVTRMLTEGN